MTRLKTRLKFQKIKEQKGGFTLIELMVSLSIFVVIMTLVMGAVLGILSINSKTQSEKTAMDNLDFALESMSRTIRFGTNYHAGNGSGDLCLTNQTALTAPRDCQPGTSSLTVQASDGTLVTYGLTSGVLMRSVNGGTPLALTSPEVNITALTFRVFGSYSYGSGANQDLLQPQVIITISGIAGSVNKAVTQATFQLETTVSQRKLDI